MCSGIALAYSELPAELIQQHGLQSSVYDRGGEKEIRFLSRQASRMLPIWHEGKLRLVRWGCRSQESKVLPCTAWTWLSSVEEGHWAGWQGEAVDIPATMGLENGVWFRIRQGIRGILVQDEHGVDVVYMLCEPATHYYEVMTRSKRMPVLIGERI